MSRGGPERVCVIVSREAVPVGGPLCLNPAARSPPGLSAAMVVSGAADPFHLSARSRPTGRAPYPEKGADGIATPPLRFKHRGHGPGISIRRFGRARCGHFGDILQRDTLHDTLSVL